MRQVLLFANESDLTKEIIYFLISQRFSVHVFTFRPFKSKDTFVCSRPLQLTVSIVNLANYYNWKYDIAKYDIIINALTYKDFQKTVNPQSVFTNFIHCFSNATKQCSGDVIYFSNTYASQHIDDIEEAMLQNNNKIFYAKRSFVMQHHSAFLYSILSSRILFLSKKLLNSKISITTMRDIENYMLSIFERRYYHSKTILTGEVFTLKDIVLLTSRYLPKRVIKLPHFLLKIVSCTLQVFPRMLTKDYLKKEYLEKITHNHYKISPTYNQYQGHTLLSSVIEKHSHNLYAPHIE